MVLHMHARSAGEESSSNADGGSADEDLAQTVFRKYSERALSRQDARISELRAMSAAMDMKLSEVDNAAADRTAMGTIVTHTREMIDQSQEKIRNTCSSAERSVKRIERSRYLISLAQGMPGTTARSA